MKSIVLVCLFALPAMSFAGMIRCEAGNEKNIIELESKISNKNVEMRFYNQFGKLQIQSQISKVSTSNGVTTFAHHPTNMKIEIENLDKRSRYYYGVLDIQDPDAGDEGSRSDIVCVKK